MSDAGRSGTAVLVFARSPRAGQVKTRLMPALSGAQAARLHSRMVDHALGQACASGLGPVFLCAAPTASCPRLGALADRHGVEVVQQRGADLGARMAHAITHALERHPRVLLMGSDCPFLEAGVLRAADAALAGGARVVLVPAVDGGYVLVGSDRPCDGIFEGMPWGGERVMTETRRRLRELGLAWRELPPLQDIDRVQDLDLLPPGFLTGATAPKV